MDSNRSGGKLGFWISSNIASDLFDGHLKFFYGFGDVTGLESEVAQVEVAVGVPGPQAQSLSVALLRVLESGIAEL